jgi:cysteinyl-tRNA synthetase
LNYLLDELGNPNEGEKNLDVLMKLLIDLRQEARKSKDFARADLIRKRLAELGVTLEDRLAETSWKIGS